MKTKRIVIQNSEIEIRDNEDPIEKLRHRDTDGDGICDFSDNGYSKPNDKYREISSDEYRRLKSAGFDVDKNCRRIPKDPNNYILRYSENQKAEIDTILKPVLRHSVSK